MLRGGGLHNLGHKQSEKGLNPGKLPTKSQLSHDPINSDPKQELLELHPQPWAAPSISPGAGMPLRARVKRSASQG